MQQSSTVTESFHGVQGVSLEGTNTRNNSRAVIGNESTHGNNITPEREPRTMSGATTAAATSKVTLERSKTHENMQMDLRQIKNGMNQQEHVRIQLTNQNAIHFDD